VTVTNQYKRTFNYRNIIPRSLVHNLQRYWFIRHLLDCFY